VRDETGRVTVTISAVPPSRIMRGHDRREPAVKNRPYRRIRRGRSSALSHIP
jgi:hypothetical protein